MTEWLKLDNYTLQSNYPQVYRVSTSIHAHDKCKYVGKINDVRAKNMVLGIRRAIISTAGFL